MTQDQKKQLERQLWNIADQLRGNMNVGGFMILAVTRLANRTDFLWLLIRLNPRTVILLCY